MQIPYSRQRIPMGNGYYWPNVSDLYEQRYPTGPVPPPAVDFEPGAMRRDPLLDATYGSTAEEVRAALVNVRVAGKLFRVHRRIAEPLRRVATRIAALLETDPQLVAFFQSPAARSTGDPSPAPTSAAPTAGASPSTSTRSAPTIGATRPPTRTARSSGRTATRRPSSMRSKRKASSGAAAGITSIPCTSNTARSCSIPAAIAGNRAAASACWSGAESRVGGRAGHVVGFLRRARPRARGHRCDRDSRCTGTWRRAAVARPLAHVTMRPPLRRATGARGPSRCGGARGGARFRAVPASNRCGPEPLARAW